MPLKDPEARRAYNREYRQKNRGRLDAYKRAYLATQSEEYRAEVRKRNNAAARRIKDKRNAASKRWREANPERRREVARRHMKKYPEKFREKAATRRAATKQRLPAWFGELDELVLKEAAHLGRLREEATGIPWHVDHIIPLRGKTVSGLHTWNNLQVITATENVRKRNRFDPEKVSS